MSRAVPDVQPGLVFRSAWTALAALSLVACAAGKAASPAWSELEAVHETPALREGAKLAPEAYAAAEQARLVAERDCDGARETTCELAVDRALAGYALTEVTARAVRAKGRTEAAGIILATQTQSADDAARDRAAAERASAEVSAELEVATHVTAPRASGRAPAAREGARRRAAASLATEAELLCDAARLLTASTKGTAGATGGPSTTDDGPSADPALVHLREELAAASRSTSAGAGPLLDDATRTRAACLGQLSSARAEAAETARKASNRTDGETLLTQVASATSAGSSTDVTAHRDERGVVVVLESAFDGEKLSAAAEGILRTVAAFAAPRGLALQLVAHDATRPDEGPETEPHRTLVERRLAAAEAIVDAAGIRPARRHTARAFGHLPLVDPDDAARRSRNERLDVVLVD